jgi:hypothetical protein
MTPNKDKESIRHYWSQNDAVDLLARQERLRQDQAWRWQIEDEYKRGYRMPEWIMRFVRWIRKTK